MEKTWIYTIISVTIVSLISLIGAATLALKKNRLEPILLLLVAFSAGALLGGAMFHLIPEAIAENGFSLKITAYVLAGMLMFFVLEKIVHWRHCHEIDCKEHKHHLGIMNLMGDTVHNFMDGVLIAGSFMVNIPLGISVTIATMLHEIPQEIGDFGMLIYSGYKTKKALLYNFLSACSAIVGAILTLIAGSRIENLTEIIIPVTAGGFIYIASTDLMPELHKEVKITKSLTQLIVIILGIALMYGMTTLRLG